MSCGVNCTWINNMKKYINKVWNMTTEERREGAFILLGKALRAFSKQLRDNWLVLSFLATISYKMSTYVGGIIAGRYNTTMNDVSYTKQGHINDSMRIDAAVKDIAGIHMEDTVQNRQIFLLAAKANGMTEVNCIRPYFQLLDLGINVKCADNCIVSNP